MLSKWSDYAKWRHPITWWTIQLKQYHLKTNPGVKKPSPKIVSINDEKICYKLARDKAELTIHKKDIMGVVHPELN